jgi:hypothetical protein
MFDKLKLKLKLKLLELTEKVDELKKKLEDKKGKRVLLGVAVVLVVLLFVFSYSV